MLTPILFRQRQAMPAAICAVDLSSMRRENRFVKVHATTYFRSKVHATTYFRSKVQVSTGVSYTSKYGQFFCLIHSPTKIFQKMPASDIPKPAFASNLKF